jgi:hypothetical protein
MSLLWISGFVVARALSVPASAQTTQPANNLSKGVAGCLLSARTALGGSRRMPKRSMPILPMVRSTSTILS